MTQTALITGGARRVGAALARALAAAGYFVVIHYQNSVDEAEGLARELGGACGILRADLRDREAVALLLPRCLAAFGPVDVLVNNASSYRYDGIASLEADSWDENMRTNLEAPLFLASAFHAALGGRGGAIVNMLDFKVTSLNPDFFSYSVAKVGMAGATRMMAMAFGGRVRVNGVAPGLTMRSGRQSEEQFQRAWRMTPLGHGPTPTELGAALLFLLHTPSVNGQVISLDGGAGLRPRRRDISVDPSALGAGHVSRW